LANVYDWAGLIERRLMLGTACHGPWGDIRRVFLGRRIRHQLDKFRHAMNVAATTQAFAEPLVATTDAFVRADAGGFYDD
jgi:hypothetical protein